MLEGSPETYWWVKHPDRGWITAPPCEAGSALIEFGWPIQLGSSPNLPTLDSLDLLSEALYWNAEAKSVRDEMGLLKLCRSMADRLRVNVSDPMEEDAIYLVLERQRYDREQEQELAEILRGTDYE